MQTAYASNLAQPNVSAYFHIKILNVYKQGINIIHINSKSVFLPHIESTNMCHLPPVHLSLIALVVLTVDTFQRLCTTNSLMYSQHQLGFPLPPSHFYSAGRPYKIPTSPPILWGNIKFILQPGGPRHPSTATVLEGHQNIWQQKRESSKRFPTILFVSDLFTADNNSIAIGLCTAQFLLIMLGPNLHQGRVY